MTIVGANGKPITAKAITSVHIVVLHQPAGGGMAQKIKVLAAEVDGTLAGAKQVLEGAVSQVLKHLVTLKAVSPVIKPQKRR